LKSEIKKKRKEKMDKKKNGKRLPEGPPEDEPEDEPKEKRRRVEKEEAIRRDWREEIERFRHVLLDPDTWSKHVVEGSQQSALEIVRILERIFTRKRPSDYVDLMLADVRSIPEVVFESHLFTHIILDTSLDTNKNLLTLPPAIGAWTGHYLFLVGTGITHLPHEIGDCQQLRDVDLIGSDIQELPRSLGKCPMLKAVFLDFKATRDPKRPLLSQFAGHSAGGIARKLKHDWDAYVTRMSCFLFCIESRICKYSTEGSTGDLPCDILARIGSFL
jgi:hypothetical protein